MQEALWLSGLISAQVVCPAEAYRLIPELHLHLVGTGCILDGEFITDAAGTAGERRIVGCCANDANITLRRRLVESQRENSVVLEVINRSDQTRCHVPLLIAQNGLEDLDLIRAGDDQMMRLELQLICIVGIA